ncbi:MAG: hypothetical protein HYU29_02415 [Chloroflexi bacterium]|nr:hypothetical protein [Chloroflexota bacterium]
MENIVPVLTAISVLVAVVSVAAGIFYALSRLRAGEPVRLPVRLLLRGYLHTVALVGLVLLALGLSSLLQSAFGATLGKEFSYNPVYIAPRPVVPPEKGMEPVNGEETRQKGLERAFQEGLINGVSLTVVGSIIWGLHLWGRRRIENPEERAGVLSRFYVMLGLALFSLIAIVNLPQALAGTIRYYALEPLDPFQRAHPPGSKLALALVSMPIWLSYLLRAIKSIRSPGEEQ